MSKEISKPLLWEEIENGKKIFDFAKGLAEKLEKICGKKHFEKRKIFILGAYVNDDESWEISPKQELFKLKISLQEIKDICSFIMEDFGKLLEEDLINKFYILAQLSDLIVNVIECDEKRFIIGIGHILELGIILAKRELTEKTVVYVKKGAKLSLMLEKGAFKEHYIGSRVFFFESTEELIQKVKHFVLNELQ